ncbi:MAG TPA: NAD-dependent succinate-semialdehyde dehydrogenase [Trueperaceae bacterium]
MSLTTINPATGDILRTYQPLGAAELETALAATHMAFEAWRQLAIPARAEPMRHAAELLRERASDYAQLMAREMGKPLPQGRAEAEKCAWVCDYYAEHAGAFLQDEPVDTGARVSKVSFRPLGPVLAVMPWNFPFWQVFRFAAPALMAGNTALLKHAPNVTGCALAIQEIFEQAGFPAGVFQALLIEVAQVEKVIADPRVRAVTLTGSTRAGRAVAAKAGEMLKKTVLELGGSDAYVILEDADLDAAAATCAASRLTNSGQSCIAAKRFIVPQVVRGDFEAKLVARLERVTMGDPTEPGVELGPQARLDLRDNLHRQVQESVARGARCLLGGELPEGPGAFYPPTVLTEVRPGMPAYEEELFGPVAAVIPVADETEALRVANDSKYGLGAALFTSNPARGERLATETLEAGAVFVNDFVRSDPRLPFGGIKDSGYGRELSIFGIREFVNVKTVVVA